MPQIPCGVGLLGSCCYRLLALTHGKRCGGPWPGDVDEDEALYLRPLFCWIGCPCVSCFERTQRQSPKMRCAGLFSSMAGFHCV